MQKHTVYAKTYSICNNIQYMQIIEYMQKHKQYAKTYSICQIYKICKNIQNMQNLLFYRICNNMQKYAKPALFRRSQVLVTLCSFCGPTGYVQLEERGGRAGVAGFRPPPLCMSTKWGSLSGKNRFAAPLHAQ